MKTIKYDLQSLDVYYAKHDFEKTIPIYVHIKDIKPYRKNELEIEVFESENLYAYKKLEELDSLKRNFVFINTKDNLYPDENGNKLRINFLDYYELDCIDDLLYKEELDKEFFISLNNHIEKIKQIVFNEYVRRLKIIFKTEKKEPNLKLKKDFGLKNKALEEEVKDYTSMDYNYIIAQLGIEHNPTVYFTENIGKAVIDWSSREFEYHMFYLTAKTKKENVSNKSHAKIQEESMPETNNK